MGERRVAPPPVRLLRLRQGPCLEPRRTITRRWWSYAGRPERGATSRLGRSRRRTSGAGTGQAALLEKLCKNGDSVARPLYTATWKATPHSNQFPRARFGRNRVCLPALGTSPAADIGIEWPFRDRRLPISERAA